MEDDKKPHVHHHSFGYTPPKKMPHPDQPARDKRKRSAVVAVGAVGLLASGYALFSGHDVQRNSYASKEDCERDYTTGQCTYQQSVSGHGGGYGGGGYRYYGPWYRSDWATHPTKGDPGPGRSFASRAGTSGFTGHGPTGFDFGSRGGFGASGRVSARGG